MFGVRREAKSHRVGRMQDVTPNRVKLHGAVRFRLFMDLTPFPAPLTTVGGDALFCRDQVCPAGQIS